MLLSNNPGSSHSSNIHDIDSTGIHSLEDLIEYLERKQIGFYLARPIGPVRDTITRHGLINKIGVEKCFLSVADAIDAYWIEKEHIEKKNASAILHKKMKSKKKKAKKQ